ncbi:hypothetical protein DRJ19_02335 [Candidatus Woesearchaeota archaeon]|nr:MAG: hypothetical protein DRJ19_02335 [Candidatus Woesearchaeota archaeon]RLE44607.1 MAG: hypothetical protein DRJ16_01900 [Candidatus Woesearchaeota archaeon]
MLDKKQLTKNRIDLEYTFESKKAILYITFVTITLMGVFTGLWINGQKVLALVLTAIIFVLSLILYKKTKNKMDELLRKLEDLN